jgi:signal peptidase
LKKAVMSIIAIVSIMVIVISVLLLSVIGMGWKMGTVVSGSMSPVLHVGEFAVAQPTDPGTIKEGDIIAFKAPDEPDTVITHRVIGVVNKGDSVAFRTKGDANSSPDGFLVPADNLEGKIVFHVPYFGYLIGWSRTPLALALIIGIPTAIVIVWLRRKLRGLALPKTQRTAETEVAAAK